MLINQHSHMKEVLLYKKLDNKKVQCHVCNHYCTILPGKRGICGVRENIDGKLYLLVYGKAISEAVDPIEKKPLYHFLPGTFSLSIATVGCNLRCDNCQNWQISQASKTKDYKDLNIFGEDLSPEKVIQDAKVNNCPSISYTYTEPTIFMEYALDCMKLAHKAGLKNVWVSNGYMSKETLELVSPYLDAANIDLKFFDNKTYQKNCGAKLEPILENIKEIKKRKIWLEITTLVIPTLSDHTEMFEKIAGFIKNELGTETPWHVSAFSPEISYKLQNLPATEVDTLKKAYEIGKKAGLKYVYTGNIPKLNSENTYCPKCGEMVIKRMGYIVERRDKEGKCQKCGEKLDFVLK